MTIHIALLRAVNVAGHQSIRMKALCAWLEGEGFTDVRSLLASGNLVFGGGRRSGAALERWMEAEAARRFGLATDFFVRTPEEWRAVIAGNPFRAFAEDDPGHLIVVALKDAPGAAQVKALQGSITGREQVRAAGRHAYITYPDGAGSSKLTMARIEKALGTRGTGRNWNTVLKLGAMVEG